MSELPDAAVEAAAKAAYEHANYGVPWDKCRDEWRAGYRETVIAALTAALPFLVAQAGANAIEETAVYLERIHPSGLTPTKAVLADLEVVQHRMGQGRHANGRVRADLLEGK